MAKIKQEMSREELVSFLERILSELKEGKLTVAGLPLRLPDKAKVEIEIETETKKDGQEIELEIKWQVPAEGPEDSAIATSKEQLAASAGQTETASEEGEKECGKDLV